MRSRSNTFFLIGILICLAAPSTAGRDVGPDDAMRLEEALIALRASDAVWWRNDAEYRAMRKAARPSETESRQFAEFVAEQRRFMLEDCRQVRQLGGDPEQLGFDCALPRQRDVASTGPPADPTNVQTEDEKGAALECRLKELEGDLDDLFKAKQDQLRRDPVQQNQSASATGTAGAAAGGEKAKSGSGENKPARENGESGESKSRDGNAKDKRERGTGPGVDKSERAPRGETSARGEEPAIDGDDVVARQLREAAMKETDPVMKEKLWEEYKKYKEATS